MGKTYGYARVSTDDQSLDVQVEKLEKFGCDLIMQEKASGKSMDGRDELKLILRVIGKGDLIVVTRTDRLGRDMLDQCMTVKLVEEKGAGIFAIDESIDTRTDNGRFYFHLMSVLAEQERRRIRARQADGIAKAKERGIYKGRKPTIDRAKVIQMLEDKVGPSRIAQEMKIGESSVFRIKREHEAGDTVTA
jgi:DNA invertase Pin-like site-specific DNA recombinase